MKTKKANTSLKILIVILAIVGTIGAITLAYFKMKQTKVQVSVNSQGEEASAAEISEAVSGKRVKIDAGYAAIMGNYAYVAEYSPGGLNVINISNPDNLQKAGYLSTGPDLILRVVKLYKGYIYAVGEAEGHQEKLVIIDIANRTKPKIVKIQDYDDLQDFCVSGEYLYAITSRSPVLSVFNMEDLQNPRLIARKSFTQWSSSDSIAFKNNRLYIGSRAGRDAKVTYLTSINVTDKSSPFFISQVKIHDNDNTLLIEGITIVENKAYLATVGLDSAQGGIHVVDITNPKVMVKEKYFYVPNGVRSVNYYNQALYFSCSPSRNESSSVRYFDPSLETQSFGYGYNERCASMPDSMISGRSIRKLNYLYISLWNEGFMSCKIGNDESIPNLSTNQEEIFE